jgi:hypothetical protein
MIGKARASPYQAPQKAEVQWQDCTQKAEGRGSLKQTEHSSALGSARCGVIGKGKGCSP